MTNAGRLEQIIKWLLLSTAFVPLLFSNNFLLPYITEKLFFSRGVILIALILAIIFFVLRLPPREKIKGIPKFIFVFGGIFLVSQILSTIFAEFPYRAFWGTLERGGGLINSIYFAVFLILLSIFFYKKDFRRYFEFSVAVGFVVYFYAILQALKVTNFPLSFLPEPRPGSFIGNSAFLAAYTFFVTIAGILTIWFSKARRNILEKIWFYLSIAVITFMPIVILLTRTRGALVGFGAAIIAFLLHFLFKKESNRARRMVVVSALVLLVVFGGILVFTRHAPFWENVPGIDRVIGTLNSLGEEASMRVRILGWKLALNAFLEKPFLGWGPDHYLRAYEVRHDPEFSAYGEVWLDRAHNGILDVAATQGIPGLIGYIGFLAGLFWFFFRKGENFYLRFFVGIAFLGFTVQNFFLLEEFHVLAPFFVLVAAIATGVFREKEPKTFNPETTADNLKPNSKKMFVLVGSAVLIVAILFVFYKTVLVPGAQVYYGGQAIKAVDKEALLDNFRKAVNPYNFVQYSIRSELFDIFYTSRPAIFADTGFKEVGDAIVDSINDLLLREGPYDIRAHIRLGEAYYEMAKRSSVDADNFYRKGEEILRKGLEISPLKQELVYGLALALAGEKKYDEAIEFMKKSIALNPDSSRLPRLHFYYGLILAAADKKTEALKAFDDMKRSDPELNKFFPNDIKALFEIYESLNEYSRVLEIIRESARGENQAKIDLRYYEAALLYYLSGEDGEAILDIAEFVAKKFPERKDDMETVIDLVKKGDWEFLKSLVIIEIQQ